MRLGSREVFFGVVAAALVFPLLLMFFGGLRALFGAAQTREMHDHGRAFVWDCNEPTRMEFDYGGEVVYWVEMNKFCRWASQQTGAHPIGDTATTK
jgi:hypothetical protein